LDPFYRTIEGFLILIEKEWLSFGHQFGLRNGFYTKEQHQDERSPIFLQWLDCIHQFLYQFPTCFEFNNNLLLFIAHHLITAKYGTFLFNSDSERKHLRAKNITVSIWTDILSNIKNKNDFNNLFNNSENKNINFLNPFYNHNSNNINKTLLPNFGLNKIRLWEEYFFKYLNIHEFGKFYNDFPMYEIIKREDKSMKNTLDILDFNKKKILNTQFFELEKQNEEYIIEDKNNEIDLLKKAIKDLTQNIAFSISDYTSLSLETKNLMEAVTENLPIENEGFIYFKNAKK
jgi:hypothetical protein